MVIKMTSQANHKGFMALFIFALLFSFVQIPDTSAASTNEEKVTIFLRDVAAIDMSRYRLIDSHDVPNAGFKYTFESDNGTFYVLCSFSNGDLIACALFSQSEPLLTSAPATDILSSVKGLLNRYQTYSNAAYVSQMSETLNAVTELKIASPNARSTLKKVASSSMDNTMLIIYAGSDDEGKADFDYVLFDWMQTVNGIRNQYNVVGFAFQNGVFSNFADNWNIYPVGCGEVKVSEEQAVGLAVERLKGFSYVVGDVTVGGLVLADDFPVLAGVSMQPRGGVLFPLWEIYLPLDGVYLGNVVCVRVMLWGDSGEVDSMHASSSLGSIAEQNSTSLPSATPTFEPAVLPPVSASPLPSVSPFAEFSPSVESSATVQPSASTSPSATGSSAPSAGGFSVLWVAVVAACVVAAAGVAVFFVRRNEHSSSQPTP
jgi:hypothetical protein